MKILNKKTFVCADTAKNNNKYWIIEQFDDNTVITRYGRIGDSGQSTKKTFSSTNEAEKFFNSKVKEKSKVKSRRDAYTEIHLIDDIVTTQPSNKHISDIASEQIETNSPNIRSLVKWFSDVNIHNICSNTTLSYNTVEGCFKTPLGIVDTSCINNAKILLDKISKFDNKEEKECIKIINQYLRYIPQNVGRKLKINEIFGTGDLLQKQADILEGLEAAIQQTKPLISTTERVFNTRLDIVKDDAINREINKKFNQYVNGYRINNIYEIDIKDITSRFVKTQQSIGNISQLWHATNPANILSIFKSGLIIPKKYSNGWMHGAGIYFSDLSSKSIQYMNRHYRDGIQYGYIFLSDVALGNVYYDNGSSNKLGNGYNCRWAYKNNSNSQIIIYNVDQCNLKYLIEVI